MYVRRELPSTPGLPQCICGEMWNNCGEVAGLY